MKYGHHLEIHLFKYFLGSFENLKPSLFYVHGPLSKYMNLMKWQHSSPFKAVLYYRKEQSGQTLTTFFL